MSNCEQMESIVRYAICFLFLFPHIYLQKTVHCAAAAYDTVILFFLLNFDCWWCILPWKYQRGHCTLNTIIANFILTMQLIKTILLYNKNTTIPCYVCSFNPNKIYSYLRCKYNPYLSDKEIKTLIMVWDSYSEP